MFGKLMFTKVLSVLKTILTGSPLFPSRLTVNSFQIYAAYFLPRLMLASTINYHKLSH